LSSKVDSSQLTANSKQFYFDYQNGSYGFNTSSSRGADTFSPFKKEANYIPYKTEFPWNLPTSFSCNIKDIVIIFYNGSGVSTLDGGNLLYSDVSVSLNRVVMVVQTTNSILRLTGSGSVHGVAFFIKTTN